VLSVWGLKARNGGPSKKKKKPPKKKKFPRRTGGPKTGNGENTRVGKHAVGKERTDTGKTDEDWWGRGGQTASWFFENQRPTLCRVEAQKNGI